MALVDLVEFHSLIRKDLRPGQTVVDLGANFGRFSEKMTERFGTSCYAVEANPEIFAELEKESPARCFHYAIMGHKGTVRLQLSDNALASTAMTATDDPDPSARSVDVPCIDLERFVAEADIGRIDLLKVDIEGAEIPMFAACSDDFLRAIPQITVEFHDFCGMTAPDEVGSVVRRLERLGFFAIRFSRIGHQDTLFVNRAHFDISTARLLYIKHVYRNAKGIRRMLRKLFRGRNWAEGYS